MPSFAVEVTVQVTWTKVGMRICGWKGTRNTNAEAYDEVPSLSTPYVSTSRLADVGVTTRTIGESLAHVAMRRSPIPGATGSVTPIRSAGRASEASHAVREPLAESSQGGAASIPDAAKLPKTCNTNKYALALRAGSIGGSAVGVIEVVTQGVSEVDAVDDVDGDCDGVPAPVAVADDDAVAE